MISLFLLFVKCFFKKNFKIFWHSRNGDTDLLPHSVSKNPREFFQHGVKLRSLSAALQKYFPGKVRRHCRDSTERPFRPKEFRNDRKAHSKRRRHSPRAHRDQATKIARPIRYEAYPECEFLAYFPPILPRSEFAKTRGSFHFFPHQSLDSKVGRPRSFPVPMLSRQSPRPRKDTEERFLQFPPRSYGPKGSFCREGRKEARHFVFSVAFRWW